MKLRGMLGALIGLLVLSGSVQAGSFEDSVRTRWRGAWAVLEIESYSTCAGNYFNNDVSGQFVAARGGRKFEPGELAKVNRAQIKRKKAELMVAVQARVLLPRPDGPFTLYDERSCAIELEVAVPRDVIKARNVEEVDRLLARVATRFATEQEARVSGRWNGREDDEYPFDYELTLARHAAWKAEQTNLAIDQRIAAALEQAERLTERVDDDASYLEGFAAGTREMRDWNERDCGALLGRAFETVRHRVPEERGEDEQWCEGYDDGQRLLYSIVLVRRLSTCYVEVPSVPLGDS